MNSPASPAALWATFLEAVFRAPSPVFVAVSINCFAYLLDGFLVNYQNTYPLTYFLVLGSIE